MDEDRAYEEARKELERLRKEQIVIREAKAEQKRIIEENYARMEVLRQRRYPSLTRRARVVIYFFSMNFRVDAEARLRVLEAEREAARKAARRDE